MIESIKLSNVATFKEKEIFKPSKINYLFGGNGTGKTTLGKVVDECQNFSDCNLNWLSAPIETIVYNEDFVNQNFSQSDSIKGIFTLGKGSTDAKKAIAEKREQIDNLEDKIVSLSNSIDQKNSDFKKREEQYVEKAWTIKDDYEEYFKPAYWGHIGNRKAFLEKCLEEIDNDSKLLEEDEIKESCNRVFSDTLNSYKKIDKPGFSSLIKVENNDLLQEKIIGKEDIEIGKLIKNLNNSDWVKEGVEYLEKTDEVCPFCQQEVSKGLKSEIESFFDKTYRDKINQLEQLKTDYQRFRESKITEIEQIAQSDIPILDFSGLLEKKELFEERTKNNLRAIGEKVKNPSVPISLESIVSITSAISDIIDELNKEIENNNEVVNNIEQEKRELKSRIWRFLVKKLKVDLESYKKEDKQHTKAIEGLESSLKLKKENKRKLLVEIEDLESEITSVKHSVIEINKLLKSFGFTNFELREAKKKGYYELVRNDGKKVGKTLSEGEYTFITFLYFYYRLKGSTKETGVTNNKIVVIDDPISSLDSSVLFVVSNLIKSIARDARENNNGVKQLFILTHNVYFFKEITFRGSRGQKWKEESYWLVRKYNDQSRIVEHEENPIKTTYELLWRELDEPEKINTATVFNTMRRILEYYFNILGGLDYENAIEKFEGEEKIICRSLIGWINDGSHFINDDLAITVDSSDIEKYLKVFKDIFYKMEHGSHYEMMMKEEAIAE